MKIEKFIDYKGFFLPEIFDINTTPWEVLEYVKTFFLHDIKNYEHFFLKNNFIRNADGFENIAEPGAYINENNLIIIGKGSKVESGAYIKGPAIIGRNVIIRSGAYIRENVIIGDNCVIGHATEVKHSILLNNAKAPHFNYVGNSIIGNNVNLGAGAICSNMKYLPYGGDIDVKIDNIKVSTNSRYFGCLIGDNSKIGCNVVINPGSLIGKGVITYPTILIRGNIEENSLIKDTQNIVKISAKHNYSF
ncbi:hypothetical protein [Sporosarcina sp. FSL K6-1508]|uniref:hypothetical protein n=1 Tax=Sporosarcina sp. FSL K6-1508 TaxID=2921553 RepID=UPI0030F61027